MSYQPKAVSPIVAYGPFFGITFAAIVTTYLTESSADPKFIVAKVISVFTSIVFWSLFTALSQRKEIHGGGTIDMTLDREPNVRFKIILMFVSWFLIFQLFRDGYVLLSGIFCSICLLAFFVELFRGNVEQKIFFWIRYE
ncbi:MAG: hypothetical protein ACREO1_05215 [Arenimonas sp.]